MIDNNIKFKGIPKEIILDNNLPLEIAFSQYLNSCQEEMKKKYLEYFLVYQSDNIFESSLSFFGVILVSTSSELEKNIDIFLKKAFSVDEIREILISVLKLQKLDYESFFTKHSINIIKKKLQNILKNKLKYIKILGPKNSKSYIEKIVIVSGFIMYKESNTHLLMLKRIAKVIRTISPKTQVYLAITGEKSSKTVFGGHFLGIKTDIYEKAWKEVMHEDGYLYQYLAPNTEANKIENFAKWINTIRPTCILIHGEGEPEATYSGQLLSKKYPVVYHASSIRNTPSCDIDTIEIYNEEMKERLKKHYTNIKKQEPFFYHTTLPLIKMDEYIEIYEGRALEKKENEFIFSVIIGRGLISNYFINLSEDKINLFIDLMSKNPLLKMAFVGESFFDRVIEKYPDINNLTKLGRIIIVKQIKPSQFKSFISKIDLVFSLPETTGGGGAIKTAIEEQKASLVSANSDGSIFVHENNYYYTYEEMINKLNLLAQDKKIFQKNIKDNRIKISKKYSNKEYTHYFNTYILTIEKKLNINYPFEKRIDVQ